MPEDAEESAGVTVRRLTELYVLMSLRGLGPQGLRLLHERGLVPGRLMAEPELLESLGKRGKVLRSLLEQSLTAGTAEFENRAGRQIVAAQRNNSRILTLDSAEYPQSVRQSKNPVPVLYVRGDADLLDERPIVACVGARAVRLPYERLAEEFVELACDADFTVVSGFATGTDALAHRRAFERGSRTVCVMPSGLDRPFPPENAGLWRTLLDYPQAIFVSAFPFGQGASELSLKTRNKLIVALARGVLIVQSRATGGSMNAFRFAVDERKPIATFAPDDTDDTTGNREIASNGRGDVTVFPSSSVFRDAAEAWLRRLRTRLV